MDIPFEEYRKRQRLLAECFDTVTPECPENIKENWLAVVFQETLHVSLDTMEASAKIAKASCDFHGQIMPLLLRLNRERSEWGENQ